jgi:hypothetical protein
VTQASSLRDDALRGVLKTPVQHGFQSSKWKSALESLEAPSREDLNLYESALFLGDLLSGLRDALNARPRATAKRNRSIRQAVGWVNRECLKAEQIVERPADADSITLSVPYMIEKSIPLADGFNEATPAEIIEGAVDALRFVLADIASNDKTEDMGPLAAVQRISERSNLAVEYHVLDEHWIDCLHHGWSIKMESGVSLIGPFDAWSNAVDRAVGFYRRESLDIEWTGRTVALLREVETSLIGVDRGSARGTYDVVDAGVSLAREILWKRIASVETDLDQLWDTVLDDESGLTLQTMADVWAALMPLARTMRDRMPDLVDIKNPSQLEQYAALQDRAKLAAALRKALGVPMSQIDQALGLLIWRDGRDSTWHRPIVPVGDEGKITIVYHALRHGNLRRTIEYWLTCTGNDVSEKGKAYEAVVRRDLAEVTRKNASFSNAGVYGMPIDPPDPTVGDVDLLAWVDDVAIVGEIKCLLRPATPHEWFLHEQKIRHAVEQVGLKCAWLESNREWLRQTTGLAYEFSQFLPCVVVNAVNSSLRLVDGVPLVDAYILEKYFGDGYAEMFSTLEETGTVVRFYESEREAAERLGEYLKNPKHLALLRERIRAKVTMMNDWTGQGRVVASLTPQVRIGNICADRDLI